MKKGVLITTTAILLISVANYFGIISDGSVRTIEFISIFAIGVLAGVLLTQITITVKYKNKIS